MAEMTLPPVEVTNWTDWYKLWALANRYGLLAGKNWTQPTDAETYKALVQIINDALNGTTGGNLLPAIGQGSTLLPAVAEGGQQALIAVNPTDPSVVGTISAQPIEGIVTGGGAIGSVIATVPQGSYGAVKKSVALIAIASILGTSILGFQMAQDKIEDLEFSLDPYTDDDGNVMTYTDENGKTYLPHDAIEAVRQKLIDMGAYDSGEFEPTDPLTSNVPFKQQPIGGSATSYTTNATTFNSIRTYYKYLTKDQIKLFRNGSEYSRFTMKNTATGDIYEPDGYVLHANIYSGTTSLSCTPIFYSDKILPSGSVRCDLYCDDTRIDYSYETFYKAWLDDTPDNYVYFVNQTAFFGTGSEIAGISANDVSIWSGAWPLVGRQYDAFYYLTGHQGSGGVPGLVKQEDAVIPSDPTQTLEDYFPTWTGQGKVFNTIKKGVDGTIESIGETTFLPATLKDTQPIIEGTTMNQTEAQDGTGQDDPDITDDILPAIKELLEKIINSPDIPTPTIPAGDSGDTPPAEPPVISGSANGLWAIYNPTLAQVQNFGAYLWSENILDQITRMFNSPIDAVIGFHMIYCTPIKGPAQNIKCGYLDTGVSSITVANQYATIDCGVIDVPEYYSTVLDYTATKLALYLPFIGIVPLDTAVCMGSSLQVIYRIDVLTGTCLAQVKVIKENSNAVMYAFEGNCAVQIPLTATTYTGTVTALINGVSAGLSTFMGDYMSVGQDLSEAVTGLMSKAGVKQSGSLGANAGALGIRIPYLIITHPAAYDAMRYNTQYGYPLNQTVTLGSLSGYTKVKDIHLAGIPCTDDELEQIESLLKDGVIIN